MNTSVESRLWLAVHLLYPNSSQAFDIFQAVVLQAESALIKNDRDLVYSKLVFAFDKITAVNSNLSFYEFELEEIDQWKIIYKSSQKIQLIIFVGILIFELKISDIAKHVKLNDEKTQFLFHQMFKKLVQNSSKIKYSEQLDFKKQNDLKISYLYTYENLIEFCLGYLPEVEASKVRIGLELYPVLQTTRDEYLKVIHQIQNLKVQRAKADIVNMKSKLKIVSRQDESAEKEKEQKLSGVETRESNQKRISYFFKNKRALVGTMSGFILVMFVLTQFSSLSDYLVGADGLVVIQKISKKPGLNFVTEDIAIESLPKPNQEPSNEVVQNKDESKAAVAAQAETKEVTIAKTDDTKLNQKISSAPSGGLYRGTIIVKNLKSTNQDLISKLTALGAKKAGEVELGWLKSNNTAYYHFTMSDSKINEARVFFQKTGKLDMKFESHPRLIPAGNKRFIIEVKE